MAKGLFTQGMCVLLRAPMPNVEIQRRLSMFELVGRQESIDDDAAPETLVLQFRPEVQGHLMVTPSSARWPDDMGEPDENPEAFVAWSLGQYGPLTYPGCLDRAVHDPTLTPALRRDVNDHVAHIRLLISYVVGADDDSDSEDLPEMPEGYDAEAELAAMTRAVTALLESPLAIAYFNPGGEIILDADTMRRGLNEAWTRDEPAIDMWVQSRCLVEHNGTSAEGWEVIDTVGQGQLDLPDLEAVFFGKLYARDEVVDFLRGITHELLDPHVGIDSFMEGQIRKGPGGIQWHCIACGDSLNSPPRPTLRWFADDGLEIPAPALADADDADDDSDEDGPSLHDWSDDFEELDLESDDEEWDEPF
ncbi:hypothetical protein [Crateriforma spongiae]|uniref:hypothetical protein n=1 Tax=Crateriforma spongiae TaxID=2724528 RepID=UPI00198140FF|nr:hypothetical protein [Crateriforma spongiae]